MRKVLLPVLALSVALASAPLASAQFYKNGDDPFGRWSRTETAHFRILHPEGTDSLARAYAAELEKWRPLVGLSVRMTPGALQWGPTPVILHPRNVYSNGSVAWAPKRMDLFPLPEAYGTLPQPWTTQLAVHESRHLAQMQLGYRRPFKALNYLLGEMWPGAVAGLFMSRTLLEGDAVVAETALTASGRGRSADFLNYYHVAFDQGDWRDWYRWVYGSFKKTGPDYYAAGYVAVAGMRYFYDLPTFTADYFDWILRKPIPLFPFSRYVRHVSGKSMVKTYREIQEGLHAIWTEEAEARGPFMDMVQVTGVPEFATDYTDLVGTDDGLYAFKEGKTVTRRLVRLGLDGSEEDLGAFAGSASSLFPGEGRLYWTETIPGVRWTLDGRSAIRSMDPDGRNKEDLTRTGRLYNPQPGPEGIAVVEYPVEGGCNLLVINGEDGSTLRRKKAPEGVQLTESAWIGHDLYCLGVEDRGFGIWRLRDGVWDLVVEPSVQTLENLDGMDGFLEVVSDRNGVKELYRLDPETGRAWQLSNSRYGGTDYCHVGDTLWFSSQTLQGMAIFKAAAPEPVEVDFLSVHKDRIAERLSEQERAFVPAESPSTEISAPKRYRKGLHLVRFHSWAPIYFNYDAISSMSMDLSYDTASPGLMGFYQNDLGTMQGTAGYSVHPDGDKPWAHSGHVRLTYSGLYPVLEAEFHLYDRGAGQYVFQQRTRDDGAVAWAAVRSAEDRPAWTGSVSAYIPFRYNKGGILRGWIPKLTWNVSNNFFESGTVDLAVHEDLVSGKGHASLSGISPRGNVPMQTVRASVRGWWMLPTADSQVYPRWGVGAETGGSVRPGLAHLYAPVWYEYLYGYLPGFTRAQGLRLTATFQQQIDSGAPFGENTVTVWPRGVKSAEGIAIARTSTRQARISADYALPVYIGELPWLSSIACLQNLLIVPHFDWTGFRGARKVNGRLGKEVASSLFSAGVDLTAELGSLTILHFPCSVGVEITCLGGPYFSVLAENGRSRWGFDLIFSMDI